MRETGRQTSVGIPSMRACTFMGRSKGRRLVVTMISIHRSSSYHMLIADMPRRRRSVDRSRPRLYHFAVRCGADGRAGRQAAGAPPAIRRTKPAAGIRPAGRRLARAQAQLASSQSQGRGPDPVQLQASWSHPSHARLPACRPAVDQRASLQRAPGLLLNSSCIQLTYICMVRRRLVVVAHIQRACVTVHRSIDVVMS